MIHHWVRGGCLYGFMPANGLLYTTPHPCACYLGSKLSGFCALAPAGEKEEGLPKAELAPRLHRGPAYAQPAPHSSVNIQESEAWPTYRHDSARSGFTGGAVATDRKRAWQTELGALLWVASAASGQKLAQYHLESLPVRDGMAAAGGRLYMTMADGRVICWSSE